MPLDVGKLREKYQSKSQSNLMFDKWQPKEGENSIRILPHSTAYFKGTVVEFVYEYFMHYNLGSERKTAAVCPKTQSPDAKCPICEASSAFYKSNDEKDKGLAKELYRRRQYLTNIVDLNDIQKGIQIYQFGVDVYNKLMKYVASGLFGDILDLENGRNIILSQTIPGGNKRMTSYEVMVNPEKSSITKYLPADYMEKIDGLGKVIPKAKTYEELKSILEGEEVAQPAAQAETTHQEEVKPPKTEQKPPEETPKANPDCFGKDFSLKSAKCRACEVFATCKTEFIKMIEG